MRKPSKRKAGSRSPDPRKAVGLYDAELRQKIDLFEDVTVKAACRIGVVAIDDLVAICLQVQG